MYRFFYYNQGSHDGDANFQVGLLEKKVGRPWKMAPVAHGDIAIVWTNRYVALGRIDLQRQHVSRVWPSTPNPRYYQTYGVTWMCAPVSVCAVPFERYKAWDATKRGLEGGVQDYGQELHNALADTRAYREPKVNIIVPTCKSNLCVNVGSQKQCA